MLVTAIDLMQCRLNKLIKIFNNHRSSSHHIMISNCLPTLRAEIASAVRNDNDCLQNANCVGERSYPLPIPFMVIILVRKVVYKQICRVLSISAACSILILLLPSLSPSRMLEVANFMPVAIIINSHPMNGCYL